MNKYTTVDYIRISINMHKHGDSFVKALSKCLDVADIENKHRLANAFPEYFETYSQWKS